MVEESDRSPPARPAQLASELRGLVGRLKRRLREQTDARGLTLSQRSVLARLLDEGPKTVTALAHAEGVRSQSMGATIMVLEQAGLVQGSPDPHDRRQTILSLTDDCKEWIRSDRAAREDWLSGMIETRLSQQEQADVAKALALLKRFLDP